MKLIDESTLVVAVDMLGIMSQVEHKAIPWKAEVDGVAAQLIREGVPPFDAVLRAVDIVSRQRRQRRERATTVPPVIQVKP